MRRFLRPVGFVFLTTLAVAACGSGGPDGALSETSSPESTTQSESTRRMVVRLQQLAAAAVKRGDQSVGMDSRIERGRLEVDGAGTLRRRQVARLALGYDLLRAGRTEESISELKAVQTVFDENGQANPVAQYHSMMATAYLRLAEEANCLVHPGAEACLFPIQGGGIHAITEPSRLALNHLRSSLARDPSGIEDRWLLNVAHMTLGEYPEMPPPPFRIPPEVFSSDYDVGRFDNIAFDAGVGVRGLAGGSVMEDLDGDGDLDLMASAWGLNEQLRYFRNDGAKFTERTVEAGLEGLVSGLNLSHADFDNDGDADVLVLRGAWNGLHGQRPNSLLRNNSDGTFDDVIEEAGLLTFHPTQVGVWGDYDNDGWIDLFVGNETSEGSVHACELYRNNRDGTFSEVAHEAGVAVTGFVKGAAFGDYDNDGRLDLYISRLDAPNLLFRNEGDTGGTWSFRDVTDKAAVGEPRLSFPTWFWDYDNDGWLDLFVGSFPGFSGDTLAEIVAGYLGEASKAPTPRLYHNNGDGTFADVTHDAGLSRPMLVMGANFGDIDNDGFEDIYLGTGEPNLRTLVPNRMYRNDAGTKFQNVTSSGGFGHLQKGHGIAFGDVDQDGDQDVYVVMGGALQGDVAYNALFRNPGHGHHWVTIVFEGTDSNRAGIGARLQIGVEGPGGAREIHRVVGTGGSFGSSSLQQEVGLGDATSIESIEVRWPASGETQVFLDVEMDRVHLVREGSARLTPLSVVLPSGE